MITKIDILLYEYYKRYMLDDRLSITLQLYKIESIEDFKNTKIYNVLYKEMSKVIRKEKIKYII
jgi:hypothetical protein